MTKHLFAVLIFWGASSIWAAEPGAVAKQTREWRSEHEHEILAEFAELLTIPKCPSIRILRMAATNV